GGLAFRETPSHAHHSPQNALAPHRPRHPVDRPLGVPDGLRRVLPVGPGVDDLALVAHDAELLAGLLPGLALAEAAVAADARLHAGAAGDRAPQGGREA